eukprot:3453736-Pyramimonas_sp.AAC.2
MGYDKNTSLWCGYVLSSGSSRFYFAGDTGYCDAFKQIGRRFAPISLAAIPIGRPPMRIPPGSTQMTEITFSVTTASVTSAPGAHPSALPPS